MLQHLPPEVPTSSEHYVSPYWGIQTQTRQRMSEKTLMEIQTKQEGSEKEG